MKRKIITVIILTIIIFLIIRFGFDNKEINDSKPRIDENSNYTSEIEDINIPLRNDTVDIHLYNIK